MNKQTRTASHLNSTSFHALYLATLVTVTIGGMEEPPRHQTALQTPPAYCLSLAHLARYGKISEFKIALESLPLEALFESLPNGNTPLHEVSYPLFSNGNSTDTTIVNKALTNEQLHKIARQHAYKADLLLRKGGHELLSQLNSQKQTPGFLAAKTGYLPVLGRIILSNPCDWPFMVYQVSSENAKILLDSFLSMMKIKNSSTFPKHLCPTIPDDLQVELSQEQLSSLHIHAALENLDKSRILAQLDLKKLKYLFECYLALDIRNQYLENPEHPTVKAYFSTKSQP